MTVGVIFSIAIAVLTICIVHGDKLKGDRDAICIRTISKNESHYIPYLETYRQHILRGYRVRVRTNFRQEYHTTYSTEAACCEGYSNVNEVCIPVCSGSCENGKCVKPEVCECDMNYKLDFFGQKCDPVCRSSCNFGSCTAPDVCTCNDGYRPTDVWHNCEPVCSFECKNGYCVEPEICSCHEGYEKNSTAECLPVCERPCVNGHCVAPDSCRCDDGFRKTQNDVFACEPNCDPPCVFGSCTATDVCTCDTGYAIVPGSNSTCTPVCNQPCVFGTCIAPDTCSCIDGYVLSTRSNYLCEPVCEEECHRGRCVAPEVCECIDGHVMKGSRCVPSCDPECVNGICDSPGICKCLQGFVKGNDENSTVCQAFCEKCVNGSCIAPGECQCTFGFIMDYNDPGTCIKACIPECVNGFCTAQGCQCRDGWGGQSCAESLICFVRQPIEDEVLKIDSQIVYEYETLNAVQNVDQNSTGTSFERPPCSERCIAEVENSVDNFTDHLRKEVLYFFQFDSPCNVVSAQTSISKTYASVIGGVIGIILCSAVVYGLYLTKLKRKPKSPSNPLSALISWLVPKNAYTWKKRRTNATASLNPWQERITMLTFPIILSIAIHFIVFSTSQSTALRGSPQAVCKKSVSSRKSRYVPYHDYYQNRRLEFFHPPRWRTNWKIEYYTSWSIVDICCFGYDNVHGSCMPHCPLGCKNGNCVQPFMCECNKGYTKLNDLSGCSPICEKPCIFGKCTAPNTCTCDEGFEYNAETMTCFPKCPSGCENGWCIKPNKCICHFGYAMSDDNKCLPTCSHDCVNGKCIDAEVCGCDDGFEPSRLNAFTCEPRCSKTCIFGNCTAPEKCTCNEGFELGQDGHTCKPVCGFPCNNGWCAAPDICKCNPGFEKNEDDECVPACRIPCETRCVAPDVCNPCKDGFQLFQRSVNESVCEPVCEQGCFLGTCVAPGVCACRAGYRLANRTCEPVCARDCENGFCAEPDVCRCDPGFNETQDGRCEPVCERPCVNGRCVAPDVCECKEGFQRSPDDIFSCEPRCEPPCAFGVCIGPGVCACGTGLKFDNATKDCQPVCTKPCVNGICESPERCECLEGYEKSEVESNVCQPVCEKCVNGSCVAPGQCDCQAPFVKDEKDPGICRLTCQPRCSHGTCARDASCLCSFGWAGSSCDQPSLCVIAVQAHRNSVQATSKLPEFNGTAVTNESLGNEWGAPSCRSECSSQLVNMTINLTKASADTVYHFISIDSSCNIVTAHRNFSKTHNSAIGAGIGVLIIATVVCGAYVTRRKWKSRHMMKSESTQCIQYNSSENISEDT
ncbi:uncharacterized protein LOC124302527 isoform X1 [Neodiprion virginianus]|uniref:uncharacterized protein LOC124302527 isoform X1 n=1 Tax=Neodiprion virginianus TaxID=2961670 RepID=UPI001EE77307|nr:uncharacterized protein LOC124302527 isoform X1 [Neodiprion virginianus]XP_046614743.1 uncharacterized protein LOC124302527 isoform X1 [Neodiprion virginianus]